VAGGTIHDPRPAPSVRRLHHRPPRQGSHSAPADPAGAAGRGGGGAGAFTRMTPAGRRPTPRPTQLARRSSLVRRRKRIRPVRLRAPHGGHRTTPPGPHGRRTQERQTHAVTRRAPLRLAGQ
jgi:hypothetical protein